MQSFHSDLRIALAYLDAIVFRIMVREHKGIFFGEAKKKINGILETVNQFSPVDDGGGGGAVVSVLKDLQRSDGFPCS